jgi:hypothetical protein
MAGDDATRLNSWKEISHYLGYEVRTLERWEKEKGLPVHRVPGGKRRAIFAYPEELDAWLLSAEKALEAGEPSPDGAERLQGEPNGSGLPDGLPGSPRVPTARGDDHSGVLRVAVLAGLVGFFAAVLILSPPRRTTDPPQLTPSASDESSGLPSGTGHGPSW